MEIWKIAFVVICIAMIGLLLRSREPAISILLSLGLGVILLFCIQGRLEYFSQLIHMLSDSMEEEKGYLMLLFKATGIAIVAEFTNGICRECQMASAGELVRLFAKVSMLMLCFPFVVTVIHLVENFSFF
ncbi:MAG: SpoIIIAC/SpoIIIAD family protein [Lachnospiraceae bacterium]